MKNRELDVRSIVKLILALLITILVVIFVLANIQDTRVNFLLFTMEGPLALVLFLTFAFGVVAGILGSLAAIRSRGQATTASTADTSTSDATIDPSKRAHRRKRGKPE